MATSKGKSASRSQNGPVTEPHDVLTLSEAAVFLRVPEAEVLRLAQMRELPGRMLGGEWRFLRDALRDWLRTPARVTGKEAFLAMAGAWRDDPDIEQIVRDALLRRGRRSAEKEE